MNSTLVVCGDSFHSISNQYEEKTNPKKTYVGTHWSELLSNKLNWNLENLSMPSASNSVIVLQIMEAIELKPDFIIVGWSAGHGARIEYTDSLDLHQGNVNLGNFEYLYRDHPYIKLEKKINIFLKCTNFAYYNNKSLKEFYVNYLQHNFVAQKEEWTVIYSVIKLKESKIPFLIFELPPTWIDTQLSPWTDNFLKYIDNDDLIFSKDFNPYTEYNTWGNKPPVYHSSQENQIEISEYLYNRIRNQFNV